MADALETKINQWLLWAKRQDLELAERLGSTLNEASSRSILALKVEGPTRERREELADKANEGLLTAEDVAKHIASFLIQARQDAQKITDGLSKTAPSSPEPAPKKPKKPSA